MLKPFAALATLATLATLAAGCAVDAEDSLPVDTAPAGLSISEQRADRVRGTFERDGRSITFDFAKEGDVRTSRVSDASGVLVASTLTADVEDTVYLDGKARVHGHLSDATPTIEGDAKVFEALNAHPSARLFFALKDALAAANVPRDLFAARRGAQSGDLTPRYQNRGYLHLAAQQSTTIATAWQAWIYTLFTFFTDGGGWSSGCVQALTGWSQPVCSGYLQVNQSPWRTGANYWGYNVRVSNNALPFAGQHPDLAVWVEEL